MNEDTKQKIANVLSSSFPREDTSPKESIKNEYHVFRQESNDILKITVLVATILLFVFLYSNVNIYPTFNRSHITSVEAETIQQLVANVADCEHKSANTIHAELRKKFNYNSYKRINKSIFYKITSYLSYRTCPPQE